MGKGAILIREALEQIDSVKAGGEADIEQSAGVDEGVGDPILLPHSNNRLEVASTN